MANHKAKSKHWADIERWAEETESASDHCFLELRDRVESLEMLRRDDKAFVLRLANSCANLAADRGKFFADLIPDSEEQEVNLPEIPESSATASSLVQRVHSCIVGEPECGRMQARAVIREVATWLRENRHSEAADVLEVMEARR